MPISKHIPKNTSHRNDSIVSNITGKTFGSKRSKVFNTSS